VLEETSRSVSGETQHLEFAAEWPSSTPHSAASQSSRHQPDCARSQKRIRSTNFSARASASTEPDHHRLHGFALRAQYQPRKKTDAAIRTR
jgi:hypothetical protein